MIDIDLTVADSADEAAWLPALEDAGFELVIREPWWHEHRCLTLRATRGATCTCSRPTARRRSGTCSSATGCARTPTTSRRYRDAKLGAAQAANAAGEHVMDYNARKQPVIRAIYDRAFRAAGLL